MNTLKKIDNYISVKDDSTEDPELLRANHDLKPTPPEDRTWRRYNFALIWLQSTFNFNEWNAGLSLFKTTNLPHEQIIGALVVAVFLTCATTVLNARQGAAYHIGYPALARSVFGIRLGAFFVFVRLFVAIIWFGVQTYYGARCFDVAMRCMFGYKWYDIPNHLPESAKTTTRIILAFFLYWLIQMPLMFLHPKKIRWFFTIKSVLTPSATIGLFIFCYVKGKGPGNWDIGVQSQSTASPGNQWMHIISSVALTVLPMMINQPDTTRYAKKKNDTFWPQVGGYIPPKIVVLIFGMTGSCALYRAYGIVYWSMWDLLDGILDHEWNAGGRTGVWFVAVAYALGTAGTNIFANSIPFAADLSGLLPKYFTIVRAQIFVGFMAWAIVPWRFLADAEEFLTFLGSYSMFVGPLLGALLADYYVLRRGNLHIPSLYTKSPEGAYYYYKGFNLWGLAVWCVSPIMAIPGLYRAYHPNTVSATAANITDCSWLYTFLCGFVLHSVIGLIFKPKIYPDSHKDTPKTWEYMTGTDGFFEEDESINGVGYPLEVEMVIGRSSETEEKVNIRTSVKGV